MSEVETAAPETSEGYDEDALLDQATSGAEESESEEKAEQPEQQPASAIGEDVEKMLSDARLRPVPNETREQALLRLNSHFSGRASSHYRELGETRREAQQAVAQVAQLTAVLSPFLAQWREAEMMRQREAQMAQIPDKEQDPVGYGIWLQEQNLRIQAQREQDAIRQQQAFQQQQAALAQAHQALDVDESALNELETAVQSDPEVATAYQFMTQASIRQAQRLFPEASEDEILEFVQLAQQRDMRTHAQLGMSIAEAVKTGYRDALELAGMHPAQAQAAADQAMPSTPSASAQGQRRTGSPTAARLERESAAGRARAVVSSAPPVGGAPMGDGLDVRNMDEDAMLDFALKSPQNAEALSKAIAKTFGKGGR